MLFFIILQIVLLFFMIFHDWISIPPFNDIDALKKVDSTYNRLLNSAINGVFVLIPLIITIISYHEKRFSLYATLTVTAFYFILSVGTVSSWWIAYFFGSSENYKQSFLKFKNTHHFLPARGDNVIPNTLHVVLHFQIWICLAISIYLLLGNLV